MDVEPQALASAAESVAAQIDEMIARGDVEPAEKAAAMARLASTTNLRDVGSRDLIIEAASEIEAVKHRIFAELTPYLSPNAILTSNTSSFSVTRMAGVTDRPEQFMGLHFMNPAPSMPLVELIRGIATSKETFDAVDAVIKRRLPHPLPLQSCGDHRGAPARDRCSDAQAYASAVRHCRIAGDDTMKRHEPLPSLTVQEVKALQDYAARHGRSWKRILNTVWMGEAT